ncbi:transposase [Halomicrobium katesii]|uniref:transposase n=1 Tax=Halomicrobium katesii TaxID=437163 RepID=UPI000373D2D2|nr:transposase [Halomicrobium katesii]
MDRDFRTESLPLSVQLSLSEPPQETQSSHSYSLRIGDYDVPEREQARVHTAVQTIRFVNLVAAPAVVDNWGVLSEAQRVKYRVAVLRRDLDISYRDLEQRLSEWREVATEVGVHSPIPDYTTLSRWVNDVDAAAVDQLYRRVENASLHFTFNGTSPGDLPANPSRPREAAEYFGVSMDEKMDAACTLVEEYLEIVTPYVVFDRDPDTPNFQYPTESFLSLFAHIALENCYLENGVEVLKWMDYTDAVPPSRTVRRYAKDFSVAELERKFAEATYALMQRPGLTPGGPVHLAYDVTDVNWYGQSHEWTGGRKASNNTASAWQYGVLSIANATHKYVLNASLMKKRSEIAATFRRFLRYFRELSPVEAGRGYFDREMYQGSVVTACSETDVDYIIQAKNKGDIKRLREDTPSGEFGYEIGIEFAGLPPQKRPNAFVSPIFPEEEAADERDREHEAFLTPLDVGERDLRGLAYQFRTRWRVETAIRQLKNDFMGRCRSSDRSMRTLYAGVAQLFFNMWVALNREAPHRLGTDVDITATETLHAIRRAG